MEYVCVKIALILAPSIYESLVARIQLMQYKTHTEQPEQNQEFIDFINSWKNIIITSTRP